MEGSLCFIELEGEGSLGLPILTSQSGQITRTSMRVIGFVNFGFDKHIYNVLEVNKTSYDNCIDKDFIYNVTRGGRDVFNLTEANTYFFLSGRGYCFEGMKVAVQVREIPPEPLLLNHGFRSYVYIHAILLAMLATACACIILF
ncbi:early nodulin-like protein 20 [Prunus dulcis]|uniref:Early nodulin-like protein 20 n=1 Tax=Prunus dulcis TaxID=3755 RepID=A0A4Y1RMI1_PRUDU|nr:early nodulin-like protein 20 [Prunus dulcis]